MEIKRIKWNLKKNLQIAITCLSITSLLSSCQLDDAIERKAIHATQYPIFSICPDFNIHAKGDTLYKQHLYFQDNREFPLTGTLQVDGVDYRFMGSDSLRLCPIAPLSTSHQGWKCRYVFLFPGGNWMQPDYDDTRWYYGEGAFASSDIMHKHTVWNSAHVYVRRIFSVDVETIRKKKIYICHSHDDAFSLYLNGHLILARPDFMVNARISLPEEAYAYLKEGENVLAAHCNNTMWGGILDIGLYAEDDSEKEKQTATQLSVDVQATQTHYKFQCGQVELNVSFLSPLLVERSDLLGHPLSYLFYEINSLDNNPHHVEFNFKLDSQWAFGESTTQVMDSTDWKIARVGPAADRLFEQEQNIPLWGHLYIGIQNEKATCSREQNGYLTISCGKEDTQHTSGVLLLGYDEQYALQYFGDNLRPYWNKNADNTIPKLMKHDKNTSCNLKDLCEQADEYFREKANDEGGYSAMTYYLPYYRTIVASHRLAETEGRKLICTGDLIGCATSEQKYFSHLAFFERIDLMKALLNPIFDYCETDRWSSCYPPYDLGRYPFALHQTDRTHHPIESASAILAMINAVAHEEKRSDYVILHQKVIHKWINYVYGTATPEDFPLLRFSLDNLLNN